MLRGTLSSLAICAWLCVAMASQAEAKNQSACPADCDASLPRDLRCPAGKFDDVKTAAALGVDQYCSFCPAGTFNDGALGKDSCEPCPAGWWSGKNGSTSFSDCKVCPAGTYGKEGGQSTAKCSGLCKPGTYSSGGMRECIRCGKGRFQAESGGSICASCLVKMTTMGEGSTRCGCEAGYYMTSNDQKKLRSKSSDPATEPTCTVCGEGVTCESMTTLANVEVYPGYWRANSKSSAIYPCPYKQACTGTRSTLSGSNSSSNSSGYSSGYCAPGYTGMLCGVCEHGYSRTENGCYRCPSMGASIAWSLFLLVVR